MNLIIATDGAYFGKTEPDIVYGGILISADDKTSKYRVYSKNKSIVKMNNVGGEIIAAIVGLVLAAEYRDTQFLNVKLIYDYKGIGCWPTYEWQAKNEITKKYTELVRRVYNKIYPFDLEHVKGHTGNRYNEIADKLAAGEVTPDEIINVDELKLFNSGD